MFCPQCRKEYEPGLYRECPTCAVRLVLELPATVAPDEAPSVDGLSIACPVCRAEEFEAFSAKLDGTALTFFGYRAPNRPVTLYICRQCGHVMWFAR